MHFLVLRLKFTFSSSPHPNSILFAGESPVEKPPAIFSPGEPECTKTQLLPIFFFATSFAQACAFLARSADHVSGGTPTSLRRVLCAARSSWIFIELFA